MNRDIVRAVQSKLKALGTYHGPISGERDSSTDQAAFAGISIIPGLPQEGWQDWSDKRHFIAFLQLYCQSEGADAGPSDGWWGPQTEYGSDALLHKLETGSLPDWRDITPSNANPNNWPTESNVPSFYGPHGNPDWSTPPPTRVKVRSPFVYKIAWNMNQKRKFLWAHEKTAASVGRILGEIMRHYGEGEIDRLGINVFSGDYNPRLKRGSTTSWSMHAWCIAYDFDDTNNRYKWDATRARFAKSEYEPFWRIWESEGWVSLGREKNFDWMHVQAAKV